MQKVMFAIGHRQLEEFVEKQLRREFLFVEPALYREGVIRSVGQKNPDIIVIRETLGGNENILSIVYELRNRFSKKRIVFIAGKREPGDALLASLVGMSVYDILYGDKVKAQDIIALIRKPNEYKDVQHLQPKPVLDDKTNKVLFETPGFQVTEKEVVKEIVKEVYVDNGVNLPETVNDDSNDVQEETVLGVKEEETVVKEPLEEKPVVKVKKEKAPPPPKEPVKKVSPPETPEKKSLLDKLVSKKNDPKSTATVNERQKIITFMGAKGGVGNTAVAFNTAVSLAQKKHKVLFVEMNDRCPSVGYWYQLHNLDEGIDKALVGLEENRYDTIEKAIIRTSELKNQEASLSKPYKKFPDSLDFLFYSNRYLTRQSGEDLREKEALTKELYLHLLFQLDYDYIILDISSNIWSESTLNALLYSNKVYITVTQDVSSIGNALYVLNEVSKRGVHIDKKKNYIINKFEKADLSLKEIEDWVEMKGILSVPIANKDFINANFDGIPVLLSTKNSGIKQAFQRIEKDI